MDPAATRYTLHTLRDRRARMAGEIEGHRLAIRRLEADLAHLDAVLALLAPEADPTAIPAKKTYRRVKIFKPGDLGRLIIGVLRQACHPMSTHEIAAELCLAGDYGTRKLSARIRANLAYLESQGRIQKLSKGRNARWAMVNLDGHIRLVR